MQNKNEWGNPPYHSKNPYKVKHNAKHLRQYNFNWLMALLLATLFVLLMVFGCGCSTTLRTGKYIVEDVKGTGYTIKLKGVDELLSFPVNTLKIGDTVFLKKVYREKDANVW